MDNLDLGVLRTAAGWRAEGRGVVLGTITRTWGSAPRPVGSLVAVRDDGLIAGSVSGGCIEDDLIAQLRAGSLRLDRPAPLRYGVGAEEARRFGLPCGGTLELMLEPVGPQSAVDELLARLARGERVRRTLDLATGAVTLAPAERGADTLSLSATELTSHHGPQWRLLVIGAGQMTDYLAQMAGALGYGVTVCDPREEYADGFALPGVTLTRDMPDDVVTAFQVDDATAIVALTHDPKLDDLALMEALRSEAFYVGAIGSRVNQAKRRARLAEHFGLTAEQLDRLHGPVGLDIGARTPPEIALSILAEMTAVRYRAAGARHEVGCSV
ncbi:MULTISPECIES: XdhC family protein [Roseateles]|uniref:XdhC family protein n=1 Tax=Pelomonas caseinilytica TaxID=2906763 RepID=A0ABS8XPB4_9BURK|nr:MULTISPECIES: XdhC family protein [unclassified Roseateles]MCE4540479.1 XdhC family protein [Pelomonas sp. P7]HEV6963998.1 XdhC family protein [Roseateles sp.]